MQFKSYYRIVVGADTAVLLVHGIVGTPVHFRELIPLIPSNWSVYNILLEGHGGGVEEFGRTSMEKWKNQVHLQLSEILSSHHRVYLVGHSMGTLFCIQESILFPNQIPGMLLLNVPLYPFVKPGAAVQSLLAALGVAKPGSVARAMIDDSSVRLSPRLWKYISWIPRFMELIGECVRVRGLVENICVPCVCLQSPRDELVSKRSFLFLRKYPHLSVLELGNSGHFSYSSEDLSLILSEFRKILSL